MSRVPIRRLVSTKPAIPRAVSGAGTGETKSAIAATVRRIALVACQRWRGMLFLAPRRTASPAASRPSGSRSFGATSR